MRKRYLWIILLSFLLSGMATGNVYAQETLGQYQQRRQRERAELERMEKVNFDKACRQGTLSAYREFLNLYPKGKYAKDVRNRMADYELWSKVKTTNTIEEYQNYLQKSQYKIYAIEANDSIKYLQASLEWEKIKDSDNIEVIMAFIRKYSTTSFNMDIAKRRLYELRAVDFCLKEKYAEAYDEFIKAGGRTSIDMSNYKYYDRCMEYHEYRKIDPSSENQLRAFMAKYPDGLFYNNVSNMMAMVKATHFNIYSKNLDFEIALEYAKDDKTRNAVQALINVQKEANRIRAKNLQKRKTINFGIEVCDFGYNWKSFHTDVTYSIPYWYYNVGIGMRLGSYRSPVQLEVGVKLGIVFYEPTYWIAESATYSWSRKLTQAFHMPLYAKLKVNFGERNAKARFYMHAAGFYNVFKNISGDDVIESQFAVSGGLGILWPHWDWSMYCKRDLWDNFDCYYAGTSLAYYF